MAGAIYGDLGSELTFAGLSIVGMLGGAAALTLMAARDKAEQRPLLDVFWSCAPVGLGLCYVGVPATLAGLMLVK